MPRFIFILFFFFCCLSSFSQNNLSNTTKNKFDFEKKVAGIEIEKIEAVLSEDIKDPEVELLFKDNLCEILSNKASDLLNEFLLKKFKANV